MRNLLYFISILFILTCAGGFIYEYFTQSRSSTLVYLGFLTLICITMSNMLKDRPVNTYVQRKYKEEQETKGLITLGIIAIAIVIVLFCTS